MPHLVIAPAGTRHPALPEPGDPGVECWRDHDGRICAFGHVVGPHCWLHLPGVGSFRFSTDTAEVVAVPDPSCSRERMLDAYYRTALPFAVQARGLEALHASAVRTRAGVVALCALKETGKSTIAYAMSQRGYPLWADDAVVFTGSLDGDGIDALSVPFSVRLRPASASFFGYKRADGSPRIREDGPIERVRLAAVCVLERTGDPPADAPVSADQLASASAFTAALTHAYCFTLTDPAWKQRTVAHYLELAARVPVIRVRFPEGLHHLPAIISAIERAVAEPRRDRDGA